jgi:16S rRNA (guanine527-N7)-methyltransferase
VKSAGFRKRLADRAQAAGVPVAPAVVDRLEAYIQLLARWNEKVNLTGLPVGDPNDEAIDRLLIEPLAAARYVEDGWSPWFDVGSGGGSPAVPLALVKPGLQLTMVESRERKAAFLREVVRELGLANAAVTHARFEELAARPDALDTAKLVTIRAVRLGPDLVEAIRGSLHENGHLLVFSLTDEPYEGFQLMRSNQLIGQTRLVDYGKRST